TATASKNRRQAPAALVGLSHGVQNTRWALYEDTSVGRSRDNEIPVSHDSISRRHARLMFVDGKFVLVDMGSTNGCQVNGKPLHGRIELAEGDIIQLGDVEFRFEKKKS